MTGQHIWNHCDQLLVPIAAIPDRGVSNQFLKTSRGRGKHSPLEIYYCIHYLYINVFS